MGPLATSYTPTASMPQFVRYFFSFADNPVGTGDEDDELVYFWSPGRREDLFAFNFDKEVTGRLGNNCIVI